MPSSLLPSLKPLNVPQTLAQATTLHQQGRLAEAERLYAAILAVRPDQFDALHLLGLIRLGQGQPAAALRLIADAMRAKAPSPQVLLNHGLALSALGRQEEAAASFERATKLKSKFPEAHNNRGVVLASLGRNEEAVECYRKALAAKPAYADALSNLGNALMQLKRYDEALASYDRALAARPGYADALYNRAITLRALGRHDEALKSYDLVVKARPDLAEAWCNRGVALHDMRRFEEALLCCERALALRPDYVEAHYNRALSLEGLRRFDEALASYDRTLAIRPQLPEALSNRGTMLRELKRLDEALASYDQALALRPDLVEALTNRGIILHELKRTEEALDSSDRALAVRPDHIDALNNRGTTLQELKRFEAALANYQRMLAIRPDHPHAFSGMASCALSLCDWSQRTEIEAALAKHIADRTTTVSSFVLLGYSNDPALQLQCARNYCEHRMPVLPPPLWTGQAWRHQKIRVAYLSADFKAHATAFLMAELFERHDRNKFEIVAISFGVDDGSATRQRLVAAFDRFYDVRGKSDIEVASLLRELEIEIAVDLKGYTGDSRPEILSHRPAPIQASYLGYPGTMGAPFIDYIVADKIVAPFAYQRFFSERIVQLPGSYQVNDSKRTIAANTPARQEVGLPEQGFVFCSFNNNWKIVPAVFDVWMRLLREIDGSVLWLLSDNAGAERNLRSEAERRGVDPTRLVFAGRLPPDEHLARHRLADLFLDTLPCNAHTTASDALWAGLPVLTCLGGTFAGRVAASLAGAAALPELVANDLAEYEALALTLAREPARLAEFKARLAHNRSTCALFDSLRFARHLEAAYTQMWQTWQRGEAPKGFAVDPLG
jgi:protein O-GlcNAc transferase